VITNAELEAYFKNGSDKRIDHPKRIGFVHCVGSRDEKSGCRSCSKVCCATAVKQAIEVKEAFPDAEVFCFYMDLRLFGRHYEDLYLKAQKEYGVRFIRGRVAEVSENIDGSLVIKAEDTVASKPLKATMDLLVLMSGMRPSASGKAVGDLLEMSVEEDGYFAVRSGIAAGQRSPLPGLFLAGTATGPKTLPETLADARAAAVEIDRYLTEIFPDARNYKQLVRERW
jgi:heterodisulfide reductase subunit A